MNASVRRSRTCSPAVGRSIGRFLSAMADNPAVAAHLNTSLVELIVDDGRVVGAVVESDGARRAIRARRGVLLAAGGFEQNDAMRAEYGVPGAALDTMGAPGNLGLAHRAAMAGRREHRPDGPGLVVAGAGPSRRQGRVRAVLHRRNLRRPGRAPIRQRVRGLRQGGPRDHSRHERRHCRSALLDDLRQPRR